MAATGDRSARGWRTMHWLAAIATSLIWATAVDAATPVGVTEAEQRPWRQSVLLHGTLSSPRDAEITPRIAGLVAKVAVDAGDRVAAGDTLITLDSELESLSLNTLTAERAAARARLAEARRLANEARRLAGSNAVAETERAAREAEAAAQVAVVRRLTAAIARQHEVIDRHAVIAPFAGVVRDRYVEPGEYATADTVLLGLVATDTLHADITAPQQYFGRIRAGTPVRIEFEVAPARPVSAAVDVVVPAVSATARSFLVRSIIDNSDQRATPGMSIRGVFDLASPQPVVQIPRDALTRVPGGGVRVWTARIDDAGQPRATRRQVTLGRSAAGRVEVRSGLEPGDTVIVRGNEDLREGQAIEVVERLPMVDRDIDGRDRRARLPEPRAGPGLDMVGANGLIDAGR
ncbi:efflux RND transporter periplasmic adaptor subunit [Salinisphaera sp. SPP-AMP-43]|uniref:efflux RND transporter periplasmic adaptor subunit n=1 Tax=Salinisphaera sp. SPP-AMP-43 TaxID=3121288 RepID=UPI003C6E2413